MKITIMSGLMIALFFSCSIESEPINYGIDICEYCHMTIVDQQHASEIVTTKGRVYKFDAIECMMNYRKSIGDSVVKLYLINDFNQPGVLIDAQSSIFIITKTLPSPMGAFLSGAAKKTEAEKLQKELGGDLYTWTELIEYFKTTDGVIK